MKKNPEYDPRDFISRELSWIDFNSRVLDEAAFFANKLLERLKREDLSTIKKKSK